MQNPSIGKLIDNYEIFENVLNMMKNPGMQGQLEQMTAQTGMPAQTLLTGLGWLVFLCKILRPIKQLVQNPIVYMSLCILFLSYVLKWLGVTEGHFIGKIFT